MTYKSALRWMIFLLIMPVLFPGCAGNSVLHSVHDEVLTYPLPYDLTYLRVMEALEDVPDWELEETQMDRGMIRARNTNFSSFMDAEKRLATFVIKRIDRNQTSVQIAPGSQHVVGGDTLLERITFYLDREIGR